MQIIFKKVTRDQKKVHKIYLMTFFVCFMVGAL